MDDSKVGREPGHFVVCNMSKERRLANSVSSNEPNTAAGSQTERRVFEKLSRAIRGEHGKTVHVDVASHFLRVSERIQVRFECLFALALRLLLKLNPFSALGFESLFLHPQRAQLALRQHGMRLLLSCLLRGETQLLFDVLVLLDSDLDGSHQQCGRARGTQYIFRKFDGAERHLFLSLVTLKHDDDGP